VYNKSSAVVQTSDRKGKHGAAVTCGAWLPDNRLSLASGNRIKLSQPMAPGDVEWHTQVTRRAKNRVVLVPALPRPEVTPSHPVNSTPSGLASLRPRV
jgi:hypothetical protein